MSLPPNLEGYVTKFAPHKALKLITRGKLTFDERVVLHRRRVDVRLPGKGEFKLPWREAGPPNHHDDKVDSDQ